MMTLTLKNGHEEEETNGKFYFFIRTEFWIGLCLLTQLASILKYFSEVKQLELLSYERRVFV